MGTGRLWFIMLHIVVFFMMGGIYYGEKIDMNFCAGFIGISQDNNIALRPEINWFVAEKSGPSPSDTLNDESFEDPFEETYKNGYGITSVKILDEFDPQFYEECEIQDIYPIFDAKNNGNNETGWKIFLKFIDTTSSKYMRKKILRTVRGRSSVFHNPNLEPGKVEVEIVIDPDGKIFISKLISDPKDLYSKVERILRESPKWAPAKKNGEHAMYRMRLEIELKMAE